MSIKCQTIMDKLEQLAPKRLAEDWDNVGLQIGDPRADIKKVLVSLDLTKEVVQEAIDYKANMIITHHPLIFKPLRQIRFDLSSGEIIKNLIKNDINVYTAHTNLDKAENGLNDMLAEKLFLKDLEILSPTDKDMLYKIVIFVPKGYEDKIKNIMGNIGAGWIGNYSHCTFQMSGTGTFKPLEGTNAFIGNIGKVEQVEENRIETIVKQRDLSKTIKAVVKAHPYEEVSYDIYPLENKGKLYGLGRIGILDKSLSYSDFLGSIKSSLNLQYLKIAGAKKDYIKKVALCTGSGSEFIHKAAMLGVDAYITGDIKYHEAQQAKDLNILVVDASHFATEVIVMDGLKKYLDDEFSKDKRNIEVVVSKVNSDFIEWN
jgi:dinuclear metal center YbgI/SA1388 family protein